MLFCVGDLEANLKDLVMGKNGRRPLLQLLHPNSSRYFSRDDLASLDLSVPSLISLRQRTKMAMNLLRRRKTSKKILQELLVKSGLAESCYKNDRRELNGCVTIFVRMAVGGCDGILLPTLSENLRELYQAIASAAAEPKPEESEKSSQHILEDFHSRRTIRRLVLDSPTFSSILFKKALSGKCWSWAQGHCSRILYAFLETQDVQVREMAKEELQVLVDEGALKITGTKKPE
ncbi:hypothetical protein HID58_065642 [Brassica napus]|uniref:CPL domain-containing protein n=2 Tax=Brassica napus TaxID=3708 RepID=A0ABQ7ZDR0_BRANA|nr:hypothetical protein HID58_065642 [Brassica napus]